MFIIYCLERDNPFQYNLKSWPSALLYRKLKKNASTEVHIPPPDWDVNSRIYTVGQLRMNKIKDWRYYISSGI